MTAFAVKRELIYAAQPRCPIVFVHSDDVHMVAGSTPDSTLKSVETLVMLLKSFMFNKRNEGRGRRISVASPKHAGQVTVLASEVPSSFLMISLVSLERILESILSHSDEEGLPCVRKHEHLASFANCTWTNYKKSKLHFGIVCYLRMMCWSPEVM